MFCREHVVQVHRERDRIQGADLVVIGNGSPNFIAGFREETGWQGPLYTDPSLSVFAAAQLLRGVRHTLSPASIGRAVRTLARGFRQGRTQGNPWQQGGVVVIAPSQQGGKVVWRHTSHSAGDNAPVQDILRALALAASPPK